MELFLNVATMFKEQGDGIHLLVLHSTKDTLAKKTVDLLKHNLNKEIVVEDHRVATLRDLFSLARPDPKPNVVLEYFAQIRDRTVA